MKNTSSFPFDFPDLKNEDIAKRYVKYGYYERRNPVFRFEVSFPKDWKMINVKEPASLPDDSTPVEIGVLNRYQIPDDQKSDILAAIYVTAARVPADWSDAKAVEKVMAHFLGNNKYKILKTQEYKLSKTTLKDILLTYEIPGDKVYWARFTGFKVQDETRKYMVGKKDILYFLQLHTSEKYYRDFGAEAFYVAKMSMQPLSDKK